MDGSEIVLLSCMGSFTFTPPPTPLSVGKKLMQNLLNPFLILNNSIGFIPGSESPDLHASLLCLGSHDMRSVTGLEHNTVNVHWNPGKYLQTIVGFWWEERTMDNIKPPNQHRQTTGTWLLFQVIKEISLR